MRGTIVSFVALAMIVMRSSDTTKVSDLYGEFTEYLAKRGRSGRTISERERFLYGAIDKAIGGMYLHDLRLTHFGLVEEKAREQGKSGPWGAIITLRRLLKYATDTGYKLDFYWRDIEIPKVKHRDVESLTKEEIEQVRAAITSLVHIHLHGKVYVRHRPRDTHAQLRMRTLFEVLLHTGMRISEALSINLSDINFETEEVVIRNVKTGDHETISFVGATSYIKKYLEFRTDKIDALFVTENGRLTYATAKSYMRYLRKRAKLQKHLTHHLFRKTYCTLLLESGMDIKAVQYQARHKSERTTLRSYIAVNKRRAREMSNEVMHRV